MSRVRVLVRDGCHLCDEAVAVVDRVCAEVGADWETADVDEDQGLRERYGDQVPVTFVDGKQHDFWRVDAVRLRAALGG
ncbi:glutaredoxin family protein [Auraticoccus monumenti]|uniref:Glutaredoxin-like domain n=1 Tax=Auraticoccus monumenti TaxID=675864 RepID=A0A1G6RMQ5_9ACTN|nr:glutaredoxin family protein [Auraticoccus monumenti]SDD05721.1 Glutaredoxin-like domain [Auraticoccus monumenti]